MVITTHQPPLDPWEACFAPYDESTYRAVLHHIQPTDTVLDIGAGDLRLARRIAKIARRVVAIEMQPQLLTTNTALPPNITIICGDARTVAWPTDITLAVLLMRHCTHFGLYAQRLLAQSCTQLLTNARWGMSVEQIDLADAVPWSRAAVGWYACRCGKTGFIPAPPEQLTQADTQRTTEVVCCPACIPGHSINPNQLCEDRQPYG